MQAWLKQEGAEQAQAGVSGEQLTGKPCLDMRPYVPPTPGQLFLGATEDV